MKQEGSVFPDTETAKLQRQMEKLKQLEQILQSSDSLSPITLGQVIIFLKMNRKPLSSFAKYSKQTYERIRQRPVTDMHDQRLVTMAI